MATLNNWRVLYANQKPFLTAIDVCGHRYIPHGPIITSEIVAGELVQGGTIQTKSGSIYTLETPLSSDDDCEFARGLLIERVSRSLEKQGRMLKFEDLEKLNSIIDRVLAGDRM